MTTKERAARKPRMGVSLDRRTPANRAAILAAKLASMKRKPRLTAKEHDDSKYLQYDPFDGERDVDIKCREVKIVTVRAERKCHGSCYENHGHPIARGSRARYEHALVDGEWGSYYVCIPCMDKWFTEIGL